MARYSIITKIFFCGINDRGRQLTTALCTLTLVVTEKTVILPFFNDLRYGHHAGITQ